MQAKTSTFTRLLAFLLVASMCMGFLPAQAFATEDNDNNNTAAPAEEWVNTPRESFQPDMATEGSEGSSADLIKVHVTATEESSGETVSVAGATVRLYVGSEQVRTATTDAEGNAELSLVGLSLEQRRKATVSADKVVSRGTAIDGDDRDALFSQFPRDTEDADGDGNSEEYYRYTMELHSETIDKNGIWRGKKIPMGTESNKVDIAFAIDATGSMGDEINNVKNNIAAFSEYLIDRGLDIRFSIIEYRDITCYGEETILHKIGGTHWVKDSDSVAEILQKIRVTGGGDGPETAVDALGYVADNGIMSWRSDAYRFAFLLTDANNKMANDFGYTSMQELADVLAKMNVVTSVISPSSYKSHYKCLFETTDGIWADIYSRTFDEEMLKLSDSIIASVTREVDLHLSEPRMLVNLAVCYFADDDNSQSERYRSAVKNMLSEYSQRMAETTDGHMMVDKILLFSTANRMDFYNKKKLFSSEAKLPSMADIRIEADTAEGGGRPLVQIHSNAHVAGFFSDDTYKASYKGKNTEHFTNLPDGKELNGKRSFYRIQMSGVEGAGWDNSLVDDAYAYSTTVMHETGHYLIGLFDEYLNADGKYWASGTKPYDYFGLMDNQHTDIEMSKTRIDYAYLGGDFDGAAKSQHTYQSKFNGGSCEDTLAQLLTDEDYDDYYDRISDTDFDLGPYVSRYTKVPSSKDRLAKYPFAALDNSDFLSVRTGGGGGGGTAWSRSGRTALETFDSCAKTDWSVTDETVNLSIEPQERGSYFVSILLSSADAFLDMELTDADGLLTAELPIPKGELAEIRVFADLGDGARYNTYYVDRSEDTDAGYLYVSADNGTEAYVLTEAEESYTFIADNTAYTNGEYTSVNQGTWVSSDRGLGFTGGEIYSVASYMGEIDYTTLNWFKFADGVWTALETDRSEEENRNLGARADLDGEGLYVLMAKEAPTDGASPVENLRFTASTSVDALVTLSFDDPNAGSKYYNVYYSESEFSDKSASPLAVRTYSADSTNLSLNLLERGRVIYAAVEVVLENGARSGLSNIILIGGEADSDGDGIPDWYCDKYMLWGEPGEDKDIANSDDDGDGLSNLLEYQGGSDPTNPNDPEHTTNVAVESISVSSENVTVVLGSTTQVTATITPENATNKSITWTSADPSIVEVSGADSVCTLFGKSVGETVVYAVTADGGYSVEIRVQVSESGIVRIFGTNRCITSRLIADALKNKLGVERFDAIVVADARNFPDALAGSYLTAVTKAPILLYQEGQKATLEYINNNIKDGGTVYILGKNDSVPATVEESLRYGINAVRLAGSSRYGTSLDIIRACEEMLGEKPKELLVCSGLGFADSLSASATGLPILLVNGNGVSLRDDHKAYLESLTDTEIYVIGGTSTVSNSILSLLHAYDRNGEAERVSGSGRFATSVAVAETFFDSPSSAILAYAMNFPDGLCGGALGYVTGAPLLLTQTDRIDAAKAYAAENGIKSGTVLGGPGLISDEAALEIFSSEGPSEPDVDPDVESVTVTFDSRGGSAVESQTLEKGTAAAKPADPYMDGYSFLGWYSSPEDGEEYDFSDPVEEDMTLYAQWLYTSGEGTYTRGEWVQQLMNILELDVSSFDGSFGYYYGDTETSPYGAYIEMAEALGFLPPVTLEYPEDDVPVFRPDDVATREFAAYTAVTAMGFLGDYSLDPSGWADWASISYQAEAAIAIQWGFLKLQANHFNPGSPLTSGDVSLIQWAIDKINASTEITPEDYHSDIIYADHVVTDPSEEEITEYTVTEKTDDSYTVFLPGITDLKAKINDVLVLPANDEYIGGIAMKVTSAVVNAEGTTLVGVEPKLEEVFSSIDFAGPATAMPEAFVSAEGVTAEYLPGDMAASYGRLGGTTSIPGKLEFTVREKKLTDNLKVSGKVAIEIPEVTLLLDADFKLLGGIDVKEFLISIKEEIQLTGELECTLAESGYELTNSLGATRFEAGRIELGRLPFAIGTTGLSVDIVFFYNVSAKGTASITYTIVSKQGFQYKNGTSRGIFDYDDSLDFLDIRASAKAGLGMAVDVCAFSLMDLVGYTIEAGLGFNASFTPHVLATDTLYCGDVTLYPYVTHGLDQETAVGVFLKKVCHYTLEFEPLKNDAKNPHKLKFHVENGKRVDECTFGRGEIAGTILDKETGNPLEGARIRIYAGDELIRTRYTDSNGKYSCDNLQANEDMHVSKYKVVVSATGYISYSIMVEVKAEETTVVDTALMLDRSHLGKNGELCGTIIDAVSGDGISGVSYTVRKGWSNPDGEIVASGIFDSSSYSLTLPAGHYTIQAEREDYLSNSVNAVVSADTSNLADIVLSPIKSDIEVVGDSLRIVLSWGEHPEDLDSHLFGPVESEDSDVEFHIFYASRDHIEYTGEEWVTLANLDLDDTDSYGPETVTVYSLEDSGIYSYYVHDFTNLDSYDSTAMSNSLAKVQVFYGDTSQTFNIPTGEGGTVWHVFDYDAATGKLKPVNKFHYSEDPDTLGTVAEESDSFDSHLSAIAAAPAK